MFFKNVSLEAMAGTGEEGEVRSKERDRPMGRMSGDDLWRDEFVVGDLHLWTEKNDATGFELHPLS